LRKPEIETDDRETLKSLRRKWTCHKIHHKWEGRPIVFQPDYLGSLPTILFPRERRSSRWERKGLESKTQEGTPRGSGIGIERSSVHTQSISRTPRISLRKVWSKFQFPKISHEGIGSKISPSRVWAKISGYRNWQKIP
jgi:hypothetical protein